MPPQAIRDRRPTLQPRPPRPERLRPKAPSYPLEDPLGPIKGDLVYCWHGAAKPADPRSIFVAMVTQVGFNRRLSVNLMGKDQGILVPADDVVPHDEPGSILPTNHRWEPHPYMLMRIEFYKLQASQLAAVEPQPGA